MIAVDAREGGSAVHQSAVTDMPGGVVDQPLAAGVAEDRHEDDGAGGEVVVPLRVAGTVAGDADAGGACWNDGPEPNSDVPNSRQMATLAGCPGETICAIAGSSTFRPWAWVPPTFGFERAKPSRQS